MISHLDQDIDLSWSSSWQELQSSNLGRYGHPFRTCLCVALTTQVMKAQALHATHKAMWDSALACCFSPEPCP